MAPSIDCRKVSFQNHYIHRVNTNRTAGLSQLIGHWFGANQIHIQGSPKLSRAFQGCIHLYKNPDLHKLFRYDYNTCPYCSVRPVKEILFNFSTDP